MEDDRHRFAGDGSTQPQKTEEKQVAITGSPNTVNEVAFDVRAEHLQTPLLGTLLSFQTSVETSNGRDELLVLGQVTEIQTRNRWHEDESLKNYIKLRGSLPHLTEIGDTTTGKLGIVGAYRKEVEDKVTEYEKSRLPIPPGSGLSINQVNRELIQQIMANEYSYAFLGKFYGTDDVPFPVSIRHFGAFNEGGSGEAYMGGVFGPSGSGKSVIAASLIVQWAHNQQMGILILDPQGEFSGNKFSKDNKFYFDFHNLLHQFSGGRFNSDKHVISLSDLQLEGSTLFVQILNEKGFFKKLGLATNKIKDAIENVERFLDDLQKKKAWNPSMEWQELDQVDVNGHDSGNTQHQNTFGFQFVSEAANAYVKSTRDQKTEEFYEEWFDKAYLLSQIWNDAASLFKEERDDGSKRSNLYTLLKDTMSNGGIRIINLDPQDIEMSDEFRYYLMDFVFRKIKQRSHIAYSGHSSDSNCLIVLDEAEEYIAERSSSDSSLAKLSNILVDNVRKLRKMHCGFMFITQSIAGIRKDIYRQLHYRIYGVGLGIGADAEHMKSKEGENAFELYRALPDPRLSDTYSFMVAGVLLTLGSAGNPMFIEGFSSDTALLEANQHLFEQTKQPTLSGIGQTVESE